MNETQVSYVALIRNGRTVFAIHCEPDGTLVDAGLQPPPWLWQLRPGDRIKVSVEDRPTQM